MGEDQGHYGQTSEAHAGLMAIIWGPAINIAIFIVLYGYRRYPFYVHAAAGLFACIYTLATSIPILLTTGILTEGSIWDGKVVDQKISNHYFVGIACLALILVQTLLGIVTRLVNVFHASSNIILGIRKVHMICGYLTAIICKVNNFIIVEEGGLAALLIQDIIFAVLIVVWKFKFPKLEGRASPPDIVEPMRRIKTLKQLDPDHDYCIMANYVYNMAPIKIYHPAGYQIIQSVKNRSIDCYMYGSLPAEQLPDVPMHSHTFKSMDLVGDPVAKIDILPIFSGFENNLQVQVSIAKLKNISISGRIYQMYLSKKEEGSFLFQKYTEISQLGRFHSITLNDQVTRLYTSVNFLTKKNKKFMNDFFQESVLSKVVKVSMVENSESDFEQNKSGHQLPFSSNEMEHITDNLVPIMFKVYAGGKFTQKLVKSVVEKQQRKLLLSEAKGEGLQFAQLKPGKIIIVAGGTGLYPFSDVIDLMFKNQLIKNQPKMKEQIQKLSPILKTPLFQPFTFELMGAFQSLEDIHPITLQQLIYLSRHPSIFQLTLKLKQKPEKQLENSKVNLVHSGFEQLLESRLFSNHNISKVWICGPPKMNEGVSRFLRQSYKDSLSYLIL